MTRLLERLVLRVLLWLAAEEPPQPLNRCPCPCCRRWRQAVVIR